VAKVLEEKPRRNELEEECNCWSEGGGEGNGEEDEDEYGSMDEVDDDDEEWNQESGTSSDLISDSELDVSYWEMKTKRLVLSIRTYLVGLFCLNINCLFRVFMRKNGIGPNCRCQVQN